MQPYRASTPTPSSDIKIINDVFEGNYITVKIGSNSVDALVDTGVVRLLINEQTAKELKLKIVPKIDPNLKP